jgi:hypothetical protein
MIEPQLLAGRELGGWQDRIETAPHLPAGVTFDEIIKWGGRGDQRRVRCRLRAQPFLFSDLRAP